MTVNSKSGLDRSQLVALATVILLSPALRLFPSGPAQLAGRASWLTAIVAAPALLLYIYFISKFMASRRDGEGLAELTLRALGEKAGKAALYAIPVWLLLYAGFVLRSGADRLITTTYPLSSPPFFIISMGIVCLIAALGSARSILRAAKLVLPVVLGVLLLTLFFALFHIGKENLLPVTYHDTVPLLLGALPVVDVFSVVLYLICFFVGLTPKTKGRFRAYALWLVLVSLLLTVLCIAVVGSFGPELTARLTRPYFTLVRSVVLFNSMQRIEALVVTLWVFPDFLLVSILLFAAQLCLRLAAGHNPVYNGEQRLDMSRGRWIIWLCTAAAVICGLVIAPDPVSMELWSEKIVPGINMAFAFAVLPLIWVVGKLRKAL